MALKFQMHQVIFSNCSFPRHDSFAVVSKSSDKLQKRTTPAKETDRLNKRHERDVELKDLDGKVRLSDRERSIDPLSTDFDKLGTDDLTSYMAVNKPLDRLKDKGSERCDRDYRERLEHYEKSRVDDILTEKSRDRSIERDGRKRFVKRNTYKNLDRPGDKAKDERNKDKRRFEKK